MEGSFCIRTAFARNEYDQNWLCVISGVHGNENEWTQGERIRVAHINEDNQSINTRQGAVVDMIAIGT